jgi:hypothetical protein
MSLITIHERIRFVELRRRLLELHPDLDEETLSDTLEGATDFREALAALIRSALDDECLCAALKQRLDDMKVRLGRLQGRAGAKRQVASENMQAADIVRLQEADFTASLRRGPPGVDVVDPDGLPIDFLIPQPPKPDKRAILEALSRGALVPGAILAEPKMSLSVRSQ